MNEINSFMTHNHKTYKVYGYLCKYNIQPVGTVLELIMSNYIIGYIKMVDIKLIVNIYNTGASELLIKAH